MSQAFYSDTELLEGLAQGRNDSIEELYRLYYPVVIKWMLARGGLAADAEDVFQEAVIIIYEKAKSTEFCLTCKLSTYLFAVSKRLWLKKLQQNNQADRLNDSWEDLGAPAEAEDIRKHLEKEEKLASLARVLNQLGEPCASLIKAFYTEQKTMREIAELFHYTNPENAKTQKYKCLNRLRKLYFAEQKESVHLKKDMFQP